MLLAKIKGLALGLAAAAVVTTGVGVLAQRPPVPAPPAAQDDRLGAVEKKLDRILEALGDRRGGRRGRAGIPAERPRRRPGRRRRTGDTARPRRRRRARPPAATRWRV